jgi:acetylornithine deacetylase/succinyl-diaminopimelate desuccinylase-like protein
LPALHADIPAHRVREAAETAAEFPQPIAEHFPFVGDTEPMTDDPTEQLLNRTWRPTLSTTGADGWPATNRAGNVLRPGTSLRLSFRLPPTCDADAALRSITETLETDPPHSASVTFTDTTAASGWDAPEFDEWLTHALTDASLAAFGQTPRTFGEGGSIPFMGMLGERFPDAQFVITGVLGPGANAHGPNEFMHIATAVSLTAATSLILSAHATRP